jgi:hypothetical protein
MTRRFPPLRYFAYVLGTVNLVMASIILVEALAFGGGLNWASIGFVALVVNIISIVTVFRQL